MANWMATFCAEGTLSILWVIDYVCPFDLRLVAAGYCFFVSGILIFRLFDFVVLGGI